MLKYCLSIRLCSGVFCDYRSAFRLPASCVVRLVKAGAGQRNTIGQRGLRWGNFYTLGGMIIVGGLLSYAMSLHNCRCWCLHADWAAVTGRFLRHCSSHSEVGEEVGFGSIISF